VTFSLGCELTYDVADNATMIFNVEAMRNPQQAVLTETLTVTPPLNGDGTVEPGSGNRYRRFSLKPGTYTLRYEATVDLKPEIVDPSVVDEVPVSVLPLEVLPYLNPSRYCPSDEFARFANREFGHEEHGHSRVTAICNWIFDHVDYLAQSSDSRTSATDTFAQRAGVCRDFAHLGITFCRALGIPARFISCYAWGLQPPDFHAVFEAFVGGRWYLFDATRKAALDGLVRIGSGRDAADTAFSTIYGEVTPGAMAVWIERLDAPADGPWTVDAVSVSGA